MFYDFIILICPHCRHRFSLQIGFHNDEEGTIYYYDLKNITCNCNQCNTSFNIDNTKIFSHVHINTNELDDIYTDMTLNEYVMEYYNHHNIINNSGLLNLFYKTR